MQDATTTAYWDQYYSEVDLPDRPSKFAEFVAMQFPNIPTVLELGSGNGRDAALWHAQGRTVIAVDQSAAAIEKCRVAIGDNEMTRFVAGDLDLDSTWDGIRDSLAEVNPTELLIYARFFMHAIPEYVEDVVLGMLPDITRKYNGKVALEFRTVRDAGNTRATAEHYRRYIDPDVFNAKLEDLGFRIDYFVEGLGFAKYKEDNAYVARVLASIA